MAKRYTTPRVPGAAAGRDRPRQAAGDDRRRATASPPSSSSRAASTSSASTTPATSACRATARSPACCRWPTPTRWSTRWASREVLPQVKEAPVIAGVNGVDVLRDMRLFLEDLRHIGFSGVHNFPTVAWFDGEFRRTLEGTGLGYSIELDMLRTRARTRPADHRLRLQRGGHGAADDRSCDPTSSSSTPASPAAARPAMRAAAQSRRRPPRTQRHYDIATTDQARRDPVGARRGAGEPGGCPVHARPHRLPRRTARAPASSAWRSRCRCRSERPRSSRFNLAAEKQCTDESRLLRQFRRAPSAIATLPRSWTRLVRPVAVVDAHPRARLRAQTLRPASASFVE